MTVDIIAVKHNGKGNIIKYKLNTGEELTGDQLYGKYGITNDVKDVHFRVAKVTGGMVAISYPNQDMSDNLDNLPEF